MNTEKKEYTYSIYAQVTAEDALTRLESSLQNGLTTSEVEKRKKTIGANVLTEEKKIWYLIFWRQIRSPFNALFLLISVLSFLAGELQSGIFIALFVTINTCASMYQEYKAEQELSSLKKYLTDTIQVIRNGQPIALPSTELVPGDIIHIYPGTIIPADIRFVKTDRCVVDESTLTGESKEITKNIDPVTGTPSLFNAPSIGFAGTTVIGGKGVGVVIATGPATAMGNVAVLTSTVQQQNDFTKAITKMSGIIVWLILVSLAIVLVINVLFFHATGKSFINLFIFLLTLALTVIPEALPVVVTFTLARGVAALAKQKVVVRRMAALEDLGNIDVLCTDKTGTITENILTLQDVHSDQPRQTLFYAALANESILFEKSTITYKGFDQVIWHALTPAEQQQTKGYTLVTEFPFDSNRRRNSTVMQKDNSMLLITRGMAEAIIPECTLSAEQQKQTLEWLRTQEQMGKRTLTVAYKTISNNNPTIADEKGNLTFNGIITFIDPLKKTAVQALRQAHTMGIEVKIISGDTAEVCTVMAQQVGLVTDAAQQVISGGDFATLTTQQKAQTVKERKVFARITPEQKYEIITLLKSFYHVGYVGDGINDAPALKAADVSIVVPEATDIARQVADIILLEKNLHTIITGIQEGRRIFANVFKYVRTTLSTSMGNFYSVSIISLFVPFLPMLPVQLITVNLCTDAPMIAISTDNVTRKDLKRKESYQIRDLFILIALTGMIASLFDVIYFYTFRHLEPAVIQSGWFLLSIFTGIAVIFSLRTNQPVWRSSAPSWQLTGLSLLVSTIALTLPYTSIGRNWFSLVVVPVHNLLIIFAYTGCFFVLTEFVKHICLYYLVSNPEPYDKPVAPIRMNRNNHEKKH
ncbi:MAG: cation-transporting P-type ATPase [Candidatus Babeliales bacterium]